MSHEKWLLGSDFHIPYNDVRATEIFFKIQKWFQPDYIDILGDLDDACPVSRFAEGTPVEVSEAAYTYAPLVQDFFKRLRENSPEASIHYATGNHEQRYEDYINKKAPALRNLITPEILWKTDTYDIELSYYNNPPYERFPGMFVHHGPYALSKGGESVRKVLDDFNVSCIVGHSHRQAQVARSFPLAGRTLRGIELGHFADVNSIGMAYDRKHDWQMGGATAHIVDGFVHISPFFINDDYVTVVDGKKFSA